MLSLKSFAEEKTKKEFVNNVFAYMLVKIIKTHNNIGRLSNKNSKDKDRDKNIITQLINEAKTFTNYNNSIEEYIKVYAYKDKLKIKLNKISYDFFRKNLFKIIISSNENIGTIKQSFDNLTKLNRKAILSFFSYKELRDGLSNRNGKVIYSLYNLGVQLNQRTCPYCNKNYIFTIRDNSNKSGKLVNATFDHWLSQKDYPLFQLSFHNLIPSCSNCNSSIKNADDFTLKTHIHPYFVKKDITKDYRFNYYEDKNKKPIVYIDYISTDFELIKKLRRTFSDFKTEKIYGAQMLEIEEMRELAEAYDENYIESLQDLFPESNFTNEKIYNLLFHTSELDENHHLRPLSKFRWDILNKLKVI